MASSNSTCPKCGKPSEAKVSCHECRRTVRDSGCGECGKSLGARRGSVCAPCGYAKKPLMPCAGCGERKRIVARGRCGSCHSRAHRAERGRKLDRFEIICAGCHRPAIVGKSATRFCTHECWSRYENGRGKVVAVYRRPRVWLGGVVPSSGRGFTSGPCVYCGGLSPGEAERSIAQTSAGATPHGSAGLTGRVSFQCQLARASPYMNVTAGFASFATSLLTRVCRRRTVWATHLTT